MGDYEKSKTLEKAKKEYEDFAGGDSAFWEAEAELRAEVEMNVIKDWERQEGRKQGLREGRKEGREKGRKEGAKAKQIEIAKKMLEQNIDIENIIICTGLNKEEIKKIKI